MPVAPRPGPVGSNVGLDQVGRAFGTRPTVMLPLSIITKMIQFLTKLAQGSLVPFFCGRFLGARIVAIYYMTHTRQASSPPPRCDQRHQQHADTREEYEHPVRGPTRCLVRGDRHDSGTGYHLRLDSKHKSRQSPSQLAVHSLTGWLSATHQDGDQSVVQRLTWALSVDGDALQLARGA